MRLVPFTSAWSDEFKKVKKQLIHDTKLASERIEHIGSTSIIGMSAKPIIDIVVGVDDLAKVDKDMLKKFSQAGFLRLKVERPAEIVLAKFKDETYQEKTHFIHLVEYEGELWKNLLFFRDYLNANESAREEYLQIKLDYLEKSTEGINAYTDFKESFVKKIYKKRNS